MSMRFYTNEQVHQIVDELLLKLDEADIREHSTQQPESACDSKAVQSA